MIAMLVFAILFAGAISCYLFAFRTAHTAKATFRATSLMNTRMEALRALSFDTLVGQLNNSATNRGTITDTSVSGSQTFTWEAEKSETDADFIQVTVTVSWTEGAHAHSVRCWSHFYRNGLASKGISS